MRRKTNGRYGHDREHVTHEEGAARMVTNYGTAEWMYQGAITGKKLELLAERQQYRCALSGLLLDPDDASLDHIVPIARGGPNVMENVQIVHREINAMKGAMDTKRFVELCRLVAALSIT
jgi:5-methylcytosine-specific restriction endonuclease McrA